MKILIANIGSTSFRHRLLETEGEKALAQGKVERIGRPGGDCPDHDAAIRRTLDEVVGPSRPLAELLDLLGRKVLSDMGGRLMKFDKVVHDVIKANAERPAMKDFTAPLAELAAEVRKVTMEIGQKALRNPDEVGAAADPYLRIVGHLVFSFSWCYSAGVAMKLMASDPAKAADPFSKAKVATARFYFAKLYPETAALLWKIRAGSEALMALETELF